MYRTILVAIFSTVIAAAQPAPTGALSGKLPKVAVLNLKSTEGISQGEADLISDRLRNELFSTGMVEVMERDQMQAVLAEQGFQQSGATCSDEGCLVEFGKLLGVKMLIAGSIGKLGKLYMVNTKSINVETAQIMKVVSEDIKGEIEDVVEVIPAIALKLTCCAPGAEGREIKPLPSAGSRIKEKIADIRESKDETASSVPMPCDGTVYIEQIHCPQGVIGFSLAPADAQEIDEMLLDAFEESLDKEMITVSSDRLAGSTCSKAFTIRITPKTYTVQSEARKQVAGTLNLDVAIFTTPREPKPLIIASFTETGDRHWGDAQPLKNAFEAIAETIEDELYSKVRKTLRNAGF